jgi:hypothetical protein
LNHLAIWTGIILQFVIGFLWYGPLFGDAWMQMVGLDMSKIMADPPGAGEWITNIVASVAGVYLLALLFLKIKVESLLNGILYGFLIGFVFILLADKTSGAFAKYPYWLPWITGGFSTVGLMVAGAVLGAWRKYAK